MDLPEEPLINRLKVNVLHRIIGSEGRFCYPLIGFLKHTGLSDLARRWVVLKREGFRQAWRRLFLTHLNTYKLFGFRCSWHRFGKSTPSTSAPGDSSTSMSRVCCACSELPNDITRIGSTQICGPGASRPPRKRIQIQGADTGGTQCLFIYFKKVLLHRGQEPSRSRLQPGTSPTRPSW